MGEILDQFPALRKHMFTDFGGVQPQKKRVPSLELVVVHVDEAKQAINEPSEHIVGLS